MTDKALRACYMTNRARRACSMTNMARRACNMTNMARRANNPASLLPASLLPCSPASPASPVSLHPASLLPARLAASSPEARSWRCEEPGARLRPCRWWVLWWVPPWTYPGACPGGYTTPVPPPRHGLRRAPCSAHRQERASGLNGARRVRVKEGSQAALPPGVTVSSAVLAR